VSVSASIRVDASDTALIAERTARKPAAAAASGPINLVTLGKSDDDSDDPKPLAFAATALITAEALSCAPITTSMSPATSHSLNAVGVDLVLVILDGLQ
jgi:hypothetical protein